MPASLILTFVHEFRSPVVTPGDLGSLLLMEAGARGMSGRRLPGGANMGRKLGRVEQIDPSILREMEEVHEVISLLAYQSRVKLLALLAIEPEDVSYSAERLGLGIWTASKQLAELRKSGLATAVTARSRRVYSLSPAVSMTREGDHVRLKIDAGEGSSLELRVCVREGGPREGRADRRRIAMLESRCEGRIEDEGKAGRP
jgi:hypothetical protein